MATHDTVRDYRREAAPRGPGPRGRGVISQGADGAKIVAQTKLMLQYRTGAAVHAGGAIVSLAGAPGAVDVFTVGNDGQVWAFSSDPDSQTGVQSTSTGLVSSAIAAGRDAQGRVVLLAASLNELKYVVEDTSGVGPRWGAAKTAVLPLPQSPKSISAIYTSEIGGALYVGVLIELNNAFGTSYAFAYCVWDDTPGEFTRTDVVLSSLSCVWSGYSRDTAQFTCLDLSYYGYCVASGATVTRSFDQPFTARSAATVLDEDNQNRYFAVRDTGDLYVLKEGPGGDCSWAALSSGRSFLQVSSAVDAAGRVHLFLVGEGASLWHLLSAAKAPGQFADPMVIQTDVALMSATALANDEVQVFVVGTTQATLVSLLWQGGSGVWQSSRLSVPTSGEVEEYTSYSTDLQIFDAVGAPMPRAAVEVCASSQTRICVNGANYTISPRSPARLTASAAGCVTITQQTSALTVPTLEFRVPRISGDQSAAVEQFAGVQQDLSVVTGPELMEARLADGSYMLPEQYRTQGSTDSLAAACNDVMSITRTRASADSSGSPGPAGGLYRIRSGTIADATRIALEPGAPGPCFELDFSDDKVVYRKLSPSALHELMGELGRRVQPAARASRFKRWIGSIGDLAAGAAQGVLKVTKAVLGAVGEVAVTAITFIAEGVEYLFESAVQFVEQAFDFAQLTFAGVLVFFEGLFEWLGFLIDWDDVLRTQQAIAYTVDQYLTFMSLSAAGFQRYVDDGIASLQSKLGAAFDDLIARVEALDLGDHLDERPPHEETFVAACANNVVLNGTLENAAAASFAPVVPANSGAVLDALEALAKEVGDSEDFAQALDYFKNLSGDPLKILRQTAAALIRVARGLGELILAGAQAAVDAVLGLVQSLIDSARTMLDETWDIPFVSDFYSWLTDGRSLTLLDLMSLIFAIPSTVLYKVMYGAAPFPDDMSVTTFESCFDAQTMLANAGLSTGAGVLARSAAATENDHLRSTLLGIAGLFSFWTYGGLTAPLDMIPMVPGTPPDPLTETLSWIAVACEITAQALGCPWIFGEGAPDLSTPAGVAMCFWIYESFGVILDLGFTIYTEAIAENNNTYTGIIVAVIYGFGHAFLTGFSASELSDAMLASKVLLLCPELSKVLRLPPIVTASEGWSLVALATIDVAGYFSSGILSFVDSLSSAAKEQLDAAELPGSSSATVRF